jgi:hypothetical protein
MKDKLKQIHERLLSAPALLDSKKVSAGFDGFVDSIVKVVNHKAEGEPAVYFKTIDEFGKYISGKSGSGFSLESEELVQKLGGNMPIMANAMAQMGATVDCVGAFGIPTIAPAFADMQSNCKLHSFSNPGFTTAMEFADGKIMLAQMTDLNHANWETIKRAIGLDKLKSILDNADLICLVNWSELDQSNNIWQGLLTDVLANGVSNQKQFFFDLSDCSKRTGDAITSAISLIGKFSRHGKVTLSLNRNEANILYKTLFGDHIPAEPNDTGHQLFAALKINTLIIHSSKISAAWDANGTYTSEPIFIADPKFSTGAGDNFNAGYCLGTLLNLNTELSLIMANCISNRYITYGVSPNADVLLAYIAKLMAI